MICLFYHRFVLVKFCEFNTPEVKNANKTDVNAGHVTYTCWDKYTFPDGDSYKLLPCATPPEIECDADALKNVPDILKNGCLRKSSFKY